MTDFFPVALDAAHYQFVGLLGFALYVAMYTCLSLRIVHSDQIRYFLGNLTAATMVLISLSHEFNLASALIQMFWITMSIPAIVLRLAHRRSDRRADAATRAASRAAAKDPRRPAASEWTAQAPRATTGRECDPEEPAARGYRIDTAA